MLLVLVSSALSLFVIVRLGSAFETVKVATVPNSRIEALTLAVPMILVSMGLLALLRGRPDPWLSSAVVGFGLVVGTVGILVIELLIFLRNRRLSTLAKSRRPLRNLVVVSASEAGTELQNWFFPWLPIFVTGHEFIALMGGDFRVVDAIEMGSMPTFAGMSATDLVQIPHLQVSPPRSADNQSIAYPGIVPPESLLRFRAASRAVLSNRRLRRSSTAESWDMSATLCRNTPTFISATWKSFYTEDSSRQRLVLLYHTVDLIQRLVGSALFSWMRDSGDSYATEFGGSFLRDAQFGSWNDAIRRALGSCATEMPPALRFLRASQRSEVAYDRLDIIWKYVDRETVDDGSDDVLATWRLIARLRNKLLGHGALARRISLDPDPFLAAMHSFFLSTVRGFTLSEWEVRAVAPDGSVEGSTCGVAEDLGIRENAVARTITGSLHPYFRYHAGRLIVLNRVRAGVGEYLTFERRSSSNDAFVNLPVDARDLQYSEPATSRPTA